MLLARYEEYMMCAYLSKQISRICISPSTGRAASCFSRGIFTTSLRALGSQHWCVCVLDASVFSAAKRLHPVSIRSASTDSRCNQCEDFMVANKELAGNDNIFVLLARCQLLEQDACTLKADEFT